MGVVLGTKVKEEVLEEFENLAEEMGISKSELLRLIVLDYLKREQELFEELQRIKTKSLKRSEFCKAVYSELGKIGGNINQIARHLNRKGGRAVSSPLLDLVLETTELVVSLKERLREVEVDGDTKESP